MDDGAPTRAHRREAALRVKQAHDAGVRCSWSCRPGCGALEWALLVLDAAAPDPGPSWRVP